KPGEVPILDGLAPGGRREARSINLWSDYDADISNPLWHISNIRVLDMSGFMADISKLGAI
ncbi:MAG: hypothetical protein J5I91_02250, partial [Bacteroidetes bacterium]|nr:hypothetical protein [Bacteroidota bacterium]